MSTIPPIILVVIAIVVAHHFADIYGVAIAGIGMLSTLGIQDATDAYGPVADNAGGIVEMSDMPPEILSIPFPGLIKISKVSPLTVPVNSSFSLSKSLA